MKNINQKRIEELETLISNIDFKRQIIIDKLNKEYNADIDKLSLDEKEALKTYSNERKNYATELKKLKRPLLSHDEKQEKRKVILKFAQKFYDEGNNAKASIYMNKYIVLMGLLYEIITMEVVDDNTKLLVKNFYEQLDKDDFVGIKRISSKE